MKNQSSNCETCANYYLDEQSGMYCCDMSLDEDEMEKFLTSKTFNCPFYEYYDEYKIVRKQN